MAIAIRTGILSVATALYMIWGFRGVEYDVVEIAPPLLGMTLALWIATIIGLPVYMKLGQRDDTEITRFGFRLWLVTAAIVAIGWLLLYGLDPAAAGEFRDNIIMGVIGLIVFVAVVNFGVVRALQYFGPRRR
jgi:hypothetical protein